MKSNIEKRSKHYGDTYNWVLKVIESCETGQQKYKCHALIDNWYSQTLRHNYTKDKIKMGMFYNMKRKLLIKIDY